MKIECPGCHFENAEGSRFCRKCATPLPLSKDISAVPTWTWEKGSDELTRGTVFAGRYEVIEELGRGGMGRVYRVEDKKVNEEVVLKFLKPEIASDKKTIERFRNELKLARRVSHKNVCRMYDLNEEKGTHYISMEYVAGEDLRRMVRMTRQLSVGTAVGIAKQVCEGLAEAHRLGVVHRDLKSSNIMIDRSGNARILDFGIAGSLESKGLTGAGVMIGTPEYMSPEQVEGEADERSDIYSLGVIMYEMVTGRVPFEGDTPLGVAVKQKTGVVREPREMNAGVPEELSRVIMKCLEKEGRKRYQSAEEVYKDLDRIEQGLPTAERIVSKPKTATLKTLKHIARKQWALVAALMPIVVAVVLGIFYLTTKPLVPLSYVKKIVVLPFENLGRVEDDYFADGITEEITSRLSGLQGLGVISRTSAIKYKNTNMTVKEIGRELGVDYVLEGTVRWDRSQGDQDRVRITTQLIRVSDDTHLWNENHDGVVEDIFSLQSRIAEQVAIKMDLTVMEPERKILYAKPTDNMEAYDYFLKGRELENRGWSSAKFKEFELALQMYEKATELDSKFALAYVNQSSVHSLIYFFGIDRSEERLTKARATADKALAIQPNLSDALIALAYYYYRCLLDYDRATEIFKSVQKIQPNISPALLGYIQRRQGNWKESVVNLEKAFKFNPKYSQLAYEIGICYIAMRQYEKANEWFDHALLINPQGLTPRLGKISISVLSEGNFREARTMLETLPQHPLVDYMWFTIGMLEQNYEEVLNRLSSLSYDSFEEQQFYFHKNLVYATVYYLKKDTSQAKAHADLARVVLEKSVADHPGDPRYHAALGLAYAYLERIEDAVREGRRAVELYPTSRDAALGPPYVLNLARIYAVVGEYGKAIDQLKAVLSIPSAEYLWQLVSVPLLEIDPTWDSLRQNPAFEQLLEENAPGKPPK